MASSKDTWKQNVGYALMGMTAGIIFACMSLGPAYNAKNGEE